MHSRETGWTEADITINGQRLTFPQAMALRVAVSSFRMYLGYRPTREALGVGLFDGYDKLLQDVEQLMIRVPDDTPIVP